MTILLLGSGGREHALAWKMLQSSKCTSLFVAPGNAGTASIAKNVALNPNDFDAVKAFVLKEKVEMVVVGPEDPLVLGIYDFFKRGSVNLQKENREFMNSLKGGKGTGQKKESCTPTAL